MTVDNGGPRGAMTPLIGSLESVNLTVIGGGSVSNGITTLRVINLLVGSNSVLQTTAPSGGSTQTISATSNITVQAGGSINADGLSTSGANPGQTVNSSGGGGGAAGTGGASALGAAGGNAISDSLTSPASTGGRGGNGSFSTGNPNNGGFGGGNLRLSAIATLRVDGRISADGTTGVSVNSGGGGGGSVALSCRTLSGSGTISANGGAGNAAGGGGGGGHISIELSSNAFTGTVTAHGGSGANYGGAGLIYAGTNPQFPPQPVLPPLGGFTGVTAPFPSLAVDNGGAQGGITPLFGTAPNTVNLTVTGGAIFTNSGNFTAQNLFIGSNSTWMVGGSASAIVNVLTNATIQASGRLTVDGNSLSTSGQGQSLFSTGGGGGHGGYGGASLSNALGGVTVSDPIISPQNPGGRGGNGNALPLGSNGQGGNGGGALQLVVRGTLQLDGRVSADGVAPFSLNAGGGAGGSLWVQAGKLSGAGSISANGGLGNDIGGGGGGGRVAVWYSTNTFSGSITARGGAGGNPGGAGTIYTVANFNNQARAGQILIDNGGIPGTTATPIVNITGTPDLLIGNGGSATLAAGTAGWNSITISSNASLGIDPTLSTLSLTVFSNVTVQAGGAFSLDGHGFPANNGPGRGSGVAIGASGASHGGLGSQGTQSNLVSLTYDSVTSPSQAGSGGGIFGSPVGVSSVGGGALHLNVIGNLIVNGSITANGNAGTVSGSGGGSGGSLSLSANTFSGTGRISADGGDGEFFGGGGGGAGGRIAVNFSTNKFTGTISAAGGLGPVLAGGAGTIYLKGNFSPIGKLVLDNGGEPGADTPLPSLTLFDLFITNGAVANASSSQTFQNLFIGNGGVFSADASSLLLTFSILSNAVIDAGGAINADVHLPAGPGLGAGSVDVYGDGSGGGYGGAGGASMFGAPGGITYGFSNAPTSLGSSGGSVPALAGYSQGGGAVRLNVTGDLTVNGSISANGNDGIIDGSGGGSGGSVWITTRSLLGSGSISANGGMGESFEGGGGGGGCIAINLQTNTFAGTILALGGMGAFPGQNGTIYIITNSPNLIIAGIVTDTNGLAIVGLTVQPSGMSSVTTDVNGAYSVNVPSLWSGTITPVAGTTLLVPAERTYSSLSSNALNQNFTVVPPSVFNLSGGQVNGDVVSFSFYGINGVSYQPLCSTNLIDWVPYGPSFMGNNATASIMISTTNAPQMFFRLGASY